MQKLDKLYFTTAGFPTITKGNLFDAISDIKKLKLNGMELEFVYGMWLKYKDKKLTEEIIKAKENLIFTAHGSYFVNLASPEKSKIKASIFRIIQAAEACAAVNGYSITFHPGFYLKQDKKMVYERIKQNLKEIITKIKDKGINIWVRPETTGKETQFGDLKECISLSEDVEMVLPCIDFAHLHARYNGINNSKEEWRNMLNLVENRLGRTALDNMHIHMSGINYTEKGERNHLTLNESDIKWKELLDVLKEYKVKGTLVCESPNIEKDALQMKNYFYK